MITVIIVFLRRILALVWQSGVTVGNNLKHGAQLLIFLLRLVTQFLQESAGLLVLLFLGVQGRKVLPRSSLVQKTSDSA